MLEQRNAKKQTEDMSLIAQLENQRTLVKAQNTEIGRSLKLTTDEYKTLEEEYLALVEKYEDVHREVGSLEDRLGRFNHTLLVCFVLVNHYLFNTLTLNRLPFQSA